MVRKLNLVLFIFLIWLGFEVGIRAFDLTEAESFQELGLLVASIVDNDPGAYEECKELRSSDVRALSACNVALKNIENENNDQKLYDIKVKRGWVYFDKRSKEKSINDFKDAIKYKEYPTEAYYGILVNLKRDKNSNYTWNHLEYQKLYLASLLKQDIESANQIYYCYSVLANMNYYVNYVINRIYPENPEYKGIFYISNKNPIDFTEENIGKLFISIDSVDNETKSNAFRFLGGLSHYYDFNLFAKENFGIDMTEIAKKDDNDPEKFANVIEEYLISRREICEKEWMNQITWSR